MLLLSCCLLGAAPWASRCSAAARPPVRWQLLRLQSGCRSRLLLPQLQVYSHPCRCCCCLRPPASLLPRYAHHMLSPHQDAMELRRGQVHTSGCASSAGQLLLPPPWPLPLSPLRTA